MPVQERYPHFLTDQKQFFDELITEDWESYKSNEWDYSRKFEIDTLFRKIKPTASVSVLDIGCGCGFQDKLMANYSFVRKVDAIDYSRKSIEVAESVYPHPKVTRTVAAFEAFKAEHRYDLIVSFQVFEHLYNPEEYLRFCVEHCTVHGYVVISTPNRLHLYNRIRLLVGKKPITEDPMHYKEYTLREIKKMVRRFGLELFGSFGYGCHILAKLGIGIRGRIMWGYYLPLIASRMVAIFKMSEKVKKGI